MRSFLSGLVKLAGSSPNTGRSAIYSVAVEFKLSLGKRDQKSSRGVRQMVLLFGTFSSSRNCSCASDVIAGGLVNLVCRMAHGALAHNVGDCFAITDSF